MVTIKTVAARARLSLATVSYALRNDPKIPAHTRQRVQSVARQLGYRPNPRVSSLMAHIRGAHSPAAGERLALVWMRTEPVAVDTDPFLQKVLAGARLRTEQSGFRLEQFWTNSPGMTDRRLQQIIVARGIVGVLLSPVIANDAPLALDWEWDRFATAVIGNAAWTPELHHAGHHHYLGMRAALDELAELGFYRPAALLDAATNERAKRAWEGAFMAAQSSSDRGRQRLLIPIGNRRVGPSAWLNTSRADSLIVSATSGRAQAAVAEAQRRHLPVVTLHWNQEAPGIGGVDQCSDRIAAHAVDLVVTQLDRNETGAPDLPRMMLFPGRWVAPLIAART